MKISVIIPVYNRVKKLDYALRSLDEQIFKDFEVVIVDDGSDEDYLSMLHKHKELNVIYHKITHTGNIGFLRNEGFKYSSGDYIAILDSDDYCDKRRFELQNNILDEKPDVDILATWVNLVSDTNNANLIRLDNLYNATYDTEGIVFQNLNYGCCICHSSVLLRRHVLEKLGGYDENYSICEDYKLWMDAISNDYSIMILPEKLTYRTLHSSSLTSNYEGSDEAISKVVSIKLKYLNEIGKHIDKIIILGNSKRNTITVPLIKEYIKTGKELRILSVYEGLPTKIDADYIFVSTFTSREYIFDYLVSIGKKPVEDFIYL